EVGWPTHQQTDGVSTAAAADYVARLYLLAPTYGYIKGIWWYDISNDGSSASNAQHNFGLYAQVLPPLFNVWTPKPAACAMIAVNKLQKTFKPISSVRSTDGVWTVRYDDGQTSTFAVWTETPGARVNVTVTSSAPSGAPITASGICRTVSPAGNGSTSFAIAITNSPTMFSTTADNLVLTR
ncbi:MAG: hypothetical protein ABI612_10580, partial [Betaproteobacteria bacterium]